MHTLNDSLNLSHIYKRCIFHSNEKVASHSHVATELSDHGLRWQRGTPDTALFKARINRLQLFVLRYGAQVEVSPKPFADFALVHMSLKGCAEFECDGRRVGMPEGTISIIAPKKSIRLWWEEGSEQLMLKVPYSLLRDLQAPAGRHASKAALQSCLMQSPQFYTQWELLLKSMLNILSQPQETAAHSAWIDHFERSIALFLMAQQHPATDLLGDSATPDAIASGLGLEQAGSCQRMDTLMHYMQAKLCAPVSLIDLSTAAGVSVRTLNMLCHRHHGITPMHLLRNLRLDAAHAVLQTQHQASVTETAFQFGFGHLGRFSAYYRQRFGHLPKHTGVLIH
jgi:AraC-like DNA-binding protein